MKNTMITPTLHSATAVADDAQIVPHLVQVAFQRFHCETLFAASHHLAFAPMFRALRRVHMTLRRS